MFKCNLSRNTLNHIRHQPILKPMFQSMNRSMLDTIIPYQSDEEDIGSVIIRKFCFCYVPDILEAGVRFDV